MIRALCLSACVLSLVALAPAKAEPLELDLQDKVLRNPAAHIPSQCYTKTLDDDGTAHNPCYTCHVRPQAPNFINDHDLQFEYAFPRAALTNNWSNLFVDRSRAIAAVPDDEIIAYVRDDNYVDDDGSITLARRLADLPASWDSDGDGVWSGYVPDCRFTFDEQGFDRTAEGDLTGWRAFAYTPLPGGFWPTNGSTDDVLIRLPEPFRQTADGSEDVATYALNLAIVEALIRREDVPIPATDETVYGVDLDKDGQLGLAEAVVYDWAPLKGRYMSYVGAASALQDSGEVHLAAGLFPEGTEFLHTVRYIEADPKTGAISLASRMKEVRYMVKTRWQTYADLEEGALAEAKERDAFPDRLALFDGDLEHGISNGWGWRLQGFIEDAKGDLRPQTFEETVFCMGCHGGIGVNVDSVFAFPRKLAVPDSFAGGWYHWSQKSLEGTPEPVRADGQPEFRRYLEVNGAGDEFRGNQEIIETFFTADGALDATAVAELSNDITVLLNPSVERALDLNKAYRAIVQEQSFIHGRDAVLSKGRNVHREVEQGEQTGVKEAEPASLW